MLNIFVKIQEKFSINFKLTLETFKLFEFEFQKMLRFYFGFTPIQLRFCSKQKKKKMNSNQLHWNDFKCTTTIFYIRIMEFRKTKL